MPIAPLQNERLRSLIRKARVALDWWLGALEECIPNRLAAVVPKNKSRARLLVTSTQTVISLDSGPWMTPDQLLADPVLAGQKRLGVDVVVADEAALFRTVALPKEVRGDLQSAVKFQIKQHIPVVEDGVAIGFKAIEADATAPALRVTIAAVRNSTIRRALDAVRTLKYLPATFHTDRDSILLQVEEIAQARRLYRLGILVLVGLLVAQIMVMPVLDIRRVRAANTVLKTDLNALLAKTKVSAGVKQAVDRRAAESGMLTALLSQDNFAYGLALLAANSPDDVWFSDLQYDGRYFRITGTARDAATWVLALQQQGEQFENVRLENVSGGTAEAGAGRFQLSLQLKGAPKAAPRIPQAPAKVDSK